MENISDWGQGDGLHDLWRRTIMKCYSQVLGGRDYFLFATMHFGLRLPGSISSFGDAHSISVSDWAPLQKGKSLKNTKQHERATYFTNIEMFYNSGLLDRSPLIDEQDLTD